jgi:hypothetical protein
MPDTVVDTAETVTEPYVAPPPKVGFRLAKAEVRPLTREFTEEFRTMTPSPTERVNDPNRMKHLRGKAERGLLVPFNWSVAILKGTKYRMNGQHSGGMLMGLEDVLFPENGMVFYTEYEVDTPEDMALLFRQFDDRISSRSPADVSGAYQGLYPDLAEVNRDTAKTAAEGIAWYEKFLERLPVATGDDRYAIFKDAGARKFIIWLDTVLSSKTPELKKTPIVAAIYGTYQKNQSAAEGFWHEVARGGDDYNDRAPSTLLDTWLKSIHEDKEDEYDVKGAEFYQGCAFAWNAFRQARQISAIKSDISKKLHELVE